jgi:integrase
VFFRLPDGKQMTAKRQPPVRIGRRLMAHLRRWKARELCASYVVEWENVPVKSIKSGWGRVVTLSGLEGKVTPHTLRHSRATHMKQAGVSSFEVAQALGMSEKMVEETYGHWSTDFTERAANVR